MTDKEYMQMAVNIAKANFDIITNQGVGAIIVKDDKIISCGCRHIYQQMCGYEHMCIHAEHMAINFANGQTQGATIYVTTEPCSKRWSNSISWPQEPCCNHIIKAGISKVYIGLRDSNFGEGGKNILEEANIEVEFITGFEEEIIKLTKNFKVYSKMKDEFEEFKRIVTSTDIMS